MVNGAAKQLGTPIHHFPFTPSYFTPSAIVPTSPTAISSSLPVRNSQKPNWLTGSASQSSPS